MSVELPFAPVDEIIRRNAGDLRVSAGAAEELARRIQLRGAELAEEAAEEAATDGRKTLMAGDFGVGQVVERDNVARAAAILARHADRRTVQAEDIETYFELFE
ncbi:MAG: histone family protein [Halobaculum sp.]